MTDQEFKAEAKRLWLGRVERINKMTAEETAAWTKFGMPNYLQRAATFKG